MNSIHPISMEIRNMARVKEKRKKKKKMNSIHPISMEIRNMARVKEKRKKKDRQIVLRQFRVRPL